MKKLLFVDDSPAVRTLVKLFLSSEAYQVTEAEGMDRALKLARIQVPDVVLADYQMPGGSGLDLFTALRKEGMKEVALVLLTAVVDPELSSKAAAAGADEFVIKPVNPVDLRQAIVRALKKAELRKR